MNKTDGKGPLFMLAAAVCWSFGGLFIKFIPWDAMSIIGLRALIAAAVFIIYRRSVKIEFTKGNVLAAVCLSLTTMFFVFANKLTTAAAAILLQFTAPVFIILFQLVILKSKPKFKETATVLLTVSGMLMFFTDGLGKGSALGNLLALASGASYAGVFMCNKREDTNPEQAIFLGFLINAVCGVPFAFFNATADPLAWGSITFLGLVQVGLAYIFFSVGIKQTSALLACLITAFEPMLNPVWVALGAGETPGPLALAGGAVIIVSVVGYNISEELRNRRGNHTV